MYERKECVSVDSMQVLVEMRPPSRLIATSRKLIDVVEILNVKLMLLCCLLMLWIKDINRETK